MNDILKKYKTINESELAKNILKYKSRIIDQTLVVFDYNLEHYRVQIWPTSRIVFWRRDVKGPVFTGDGPWNGILYIFKSDEPELFDAVLKKKIDKDKMLEIGLKNRMLIPIIREYLSLPG
ncbi:MAG TPA: hypothetical protein VMX17_07895 [Candidatus Glassbacteria bacterium]|nr:hypothetical protein [Candidatus Glassbacteria bacterium]